MPTDVHFEHKGPIGYVTFSSENGVNVLSTCTMAGLEAKLDEAARHPELRVLILTGAGKTFMAGADIAEMNAAPGDAGRAFSRRGQQCMNKLAHFDHAVTIAAINGAALGGGCELALACDMRVINTEAKIGFPEVKLGLIPGWGGTQRAYMLMGPSRARRILMTGTPISAEIAASADLVNEAVPGDKLISTCEEIARQILSNGPSAVRLVKRVTSAMEQDLLDRGMHLESEAFGEAFISEEGREGLKAFLEKRKPKWAES